MEKIKEFHTALTEELRYHDTVSSHIKNLEAVLWGLEEQASFPENNSPEEQAELNSQLNQCRIKIKSLNMLLKSHETKIANMISSFSNT